MTNEEFQQLQQNDIVRRMRDEHGSGKIDGRVWSVDHESGKVRVTWIAGIRKGTRTNLHFSNLRFIRKATDAVVIDRVYTSPNGRFVVEMTPTIYRLIEQPLGVVVGEYDEFRSAFESIRERTVAAIQF